MPGYTVMGGKADCYGNVASAAVVAPDGRIVRWWHGDIYGGGMSISEAWEFARNEAASLNAIPADNTIRQPSQRLIRTVGGKGQFCRGALEQGHESHLATTYFTIESATPRGLTAFHFCDDHPVTAIKQISCGCCGHGCVCRNHMDIPRGIRPRLCCVHSGVGISVILDA